MSDKKKKSVEEVLPENKKKTAAEYPDHLHSPLHDIKSKGEVIRETEKEADKNKKE